MNKLFEQTKKAAHQARQASISNLNAAQQALSHASGTQILLNKAKTDAEILKLLQETPILHAGGAWKRRGGLGKFSYQSAWESRHFQLRGNVLLYFDSDPTKALSSSNNPQELLRGYLDFAEEKATVQVSPGHIGGAPSPFCLSIKVPILGSPQQETKWKLCFDHHATQMEWLAVLTDVVVQCSVDAYNRALLDAAQSSLHHPQKHSLDKLSLRRPSPVYEPGTKDLLTALPSPTDAIASKTLTTNPFTSMVDISPHQLWMLQDYTLNRKTTLSEEEKAKHKASVDTALQVMERLLTQERNLRMEATRQVADLKIVLQDVTQAHEKSQEEMAKLQTDKTSLEEELAIRMSTHHMGGYSSDPSLGAATATRKELPAVQTRIAQLKEELHTYEMARALEVAENQQQQNDSESRMAQEHERVQLLLTIEHERALKQAQEKLAAKDSEIQENQTKMGKRIKSLEQELESAKREYQESIQALAIQFQQSLVGSHNRTTSADDDKEETNGDEGIPWVGKSPSPVSEGSEQFEDCL